MYFFLPKMKELMVFYHSAKNDFSGKILFAQTLDQLDRSIFQKLISPERLDHF